LSYANNMIYIVLVKYVVDTGTFRHYESPAVVNSPEGGHLSGRFVLPEDPMILAAYEGVVKVITDRRQEADLPIIGAAAFGSTVKGYAQVGSRIASQNSDLDVTVFINVGETGLALALRDPIQNQTPNDWSAYTDTIQSMRARQHSLRLSMLLRQLSQENGINVNADVLPMSLQHIEALADPTVCPRSYLAARLFQLAITDGLQPYRVGFLQAVDNRNDRQMAWQHFVTKLRAFEKSRKALSTRPVQYPRTVKEMLDWYSEPSGSW
jgi:hypothetical protein